MKRRVSVAHINAEMKYHVFWFIKRLHLHVVIVHYESITVNVVIFLDSAAGQNRHWLSFRTRIPFAGTVLWLTGNRRCATNRFQR